MYKTLLTIATTPVVCWITTCCVSSDSPESRRDTVDKSYASAEAWVDGEVVALGTTASEDLLAEEPASHAFSMERSRPAKPFQWSEASIGDNKKSSPTVSVTVIAVDGRRTVEVRGDEDGGTIVSREIQTAERLKEVLENDFSSMPELSKLIEEAIDPSITSF